MNNCQGISFAGNAFVLRNNFNAEAVKSLCEFEPVLKSLIGERLYIQEYKLKTIPIFLAHLKEVLPELFSELESKYPAVAGLIKKSNVGRTAKLHTLNPNIGTFSGIHKGDWSWDGEFLTSLDAKPLFMITSDFSEVKLKPNRGATVKVTDDKQVSENTEFID